MRARELMESRMYFGGFTSPPQKELVTRYMMGECGYMALAFNSLMGYQIVEVGHHVVARDGDGFYWDIRGKMDAQQVVDGIRGDTLTFKEVSPQYVKDCMDKGFASEAYFMPSRAAKARNLVKQLIASSSGT
jgi:hypothetical protein